MALFLALAGASSAATFLIYFLIFALVVAGCFLIVRFLIPPELQRYAIAVLGIMFIIFLIYFLLQFDSGGGLRF